MANNPVMSWATKGFVFIRMNPSMHLEGEDLETIRDDFTEIGKRYRSGQDMFRLDILGDLFSIFLYDLWRTYHSLLCESDVDDNSAKIFLRFAGFVQRDCKTERHVSHYADLLCITPKYLNQVCIKVTNTPASKWIAYYTNYELIRLLDNPDKTLADIAFELNFSSSSFFTRYTKKHLGVTPSEYRRKKM
jgi:AraC-like DNA-binding protein